MKTCTKCGETKPIESFGKMSASKDGLHCWCKECVNTQGIAWRKNNRDKIHQYNTSDERREYCRNFQQKKRKENPEYQKEQLKKSRQKHKDKRAQGCKVWRSENPEKVRFYNASRKKTRLRATPKWLSKDLKKFMEVQYQMASVMSEMHGIEYHVDHIDPLRGKNVCGLHAPWNLRVIPSEDNIRKGNKVAEEKLYVWR